MRGPEWSLGFLREVLLAAPIRLWAWLRGPEEDPVTGLPVLQPMAARAWTLGAVIVVLGVTGLVAWILFEIAGQAGAPKDVAAARLDAVRIALAAGGGAGAGVGLLVVFRRQRHQEVATRLTDRDAVERRITDRYTAAIDQLGSDKRDIRIGGIYALGRIAKDSPGDHPTIVDVLSAFIREHTRSGNADRGEPEQGEAGQVNAAEVPGLARRQAVQANRMLDPDPTEPPADIQAALTVLGRRNAEHDASPINLFDAYLVGADLVYAELSRAAMSFAHLAFAELHGAHLKGADLNNARLQYAQMPHADLSMAWLVGAILTDAELSRANLDHAHLATAQLDGAALDAANLTRADLQDADLTGATLIGAQLISAKLLDADLSGSDLTDADLSGADLTGANLNGARMTSVVYDAGTHWPLGFEPPARHAD